MDDQIKTCQNCKQGFRIGKADFAFFEKLKVPAPTFCPQCRWQRHLSFRNARNLYRRRDERTGQEFISIYSPDKKVQVLEQHAWQGDSWDPMEQGKPYDFDQPFFTQLAGLLQTVPFPSLNNWDAVRSDYCNFTKGNKDCYLVFGGDFNEDTEYSGYNFYTKNSADLYWVNKGEYCYELIDSENNYRSLYGRYLESCLDVRLGYELRGCQNCVGCVNLRNKKYHVFNEPYSPEEYARRVAELDLGSYQGLQKAKEQFEALRQRSIYRPAYILNSANTSGDNIYNAKNCNYSFDIFDGAEDCAYLLLAAGGIKDSYGTGHSGSKSELLYDSMSVYPGSRIIASWMIINCRDIYHSVNCRDSSYLFGCVGLRSKKYCILNRQYSEEEYKKLVSQIVEQMKAMPYHDAGECTYGYGEFFPTEMSPFGYNETVAQEYFPLTRNQAAERGWAWHEDESKKHEATIKSTDLPDNIRDVPDTILNEIIECAHNGACTDGCTRALRLIAPELALYRSLQIPLPRLCPNCRNSARIRARNPFQLWHRKCMCNATCDMRHGEKRYQNTSEHFHGEGECPNEFETSHPPDSRYTVYCETCYQQEIN